MYNKALVTSLALILSMIFSTQIFAAENCAISTGPIPQIAQYIRSVDTEITRIIVSSQGATSCTQAPGISPLVQTMSIFDRAISQIPLSTNTFLDFRYNIEIAYRSEMRPPVVRDGQIWSSVETKITNAISTIASRSCDISPTLKASLTSLLQENQTLANIYKQAALGIPVPPTGLSPSNMAIADAINTAYIPPATVGCKDQNNIEESLAKIMKSIESLGAKNQSVWTDWQKAILLFQGGGAKMSTAEYTTIQRGLLQAELSRQGLSSRMAQTILDNFDCYKSKTQGDDSAEAAIRARVGCLKNPILGIEQILLPWRQSVDTATTTTDRSIYVGSLQAAERLKQSIVTTSNSLEIYRTPTIDTKSALMSNLIDIHIGLISTSEQIEKRIAPMYANCMKAQSSISCPKP